MWQQWTNVFLGLAVVVTPFLGLVATTETWVLVLAGLIIAALGFWGAEETTSEREQGNMMHRPQH